MIMENIEGKIEITIEPRAEQVADVQVEIPQAEAPEQVAEPVEVQVEASVQEPTIDQQYFEQLQGLIDGHFQSIKSLVKFTKEKDENVKKLTNMLQTYRDGIDTTVLKALALNVIAYREDCKKSIRQFETRELDAQAAGKYLKYIYMDFEDVLMNLGIVDKDGKWFYNGKSLDAEVCPDAPQLPQQEAEEETEAPKVSVTNAEELSAYLTGAQEQIRSLLKESAARDQVLTFYIENSKAYEHRVFQAVLYPVVRKIIGLYEKTCKAVNEHLEGLTDENGKQIYLDILQQLVDALEDVLSLCGITVDAYVSDVQDLKKHRMLKTVPTEDEALHGHIAFRYTDCYLQDEKVIYQQKVDVYKK